MTTIQIAREMAHAPAFRRFLKREAMPGKLGASEMEAYVRDSAVTFWHQACTAKMGRDEMSVGEDRLGAVARGGRIESPPPRDHHEERCGFRLLGRAKR